MADTKAFTELVQAYGLAEYIRGGAIQSDAAECVVLDYRAEAEDLLTEIGRRIEHIEAHGRRYTITVGEVLDSLNGTS